MKIFICQYCGNDFISKKACKNRTPKYCSMKCYAESLLKLKTCPVCNKSYPSDPNTKYCSIECYRIGRPSRKGMNLSHDWRKKLSEGRKKSVKCHGENLYNWKGGQENRRQYNLKRYHERRALGKIDKIYLRFLFIVQDKKCFYCGKDISKKGEKSIEHLLPISKGGTNEWINLVYSCRNCNSKKHDDIFVDYAIKNIRPDWMNNLAQFYARELADKYATAKD